MRFVFAPLSGYVLPTRRILHPFGHACTFYVGSKMPTVQVASPRLKGRSKKPTMAEPALPGYQK